MNIQTQIEELRSEANALDAIGETEEAEFYGGCADSLASMYSALRDMLLSADSGDLDSLANASQTARDLLLYLDK